MISRLLRVLKITRVSLRYGLDEIILSSARTPPHLRLLSAWGSIRLNYSPVFRVSQSLLRPWHKCILRC